jgi:hypothetical protein
MFFTGIKQAAKTRQRYTSGTILMAPAPDLHLITDNETPPVRFNKYLLVVLDIASPTNGD